MDGAPILGHKDGSAIMTAPQARNAIRKALVEIIDPKPKSTEIADMWRHFQEQCAFCGKKLRRKDRKGHADHLVAAAGGGHNHIYNRVLACANCNGDEKLDHDWCAFLMEKSEPGAVFERRKRAIEEWRSQHKAQCSVENSDLAEALLAAEGAIRAFNKACDRVRSVRNKRRSSRSKVIKEFNKHKAHFNEHP